MTDVRKKDDEMAGLAYGDPALAHVRPATLVFVHGWAFDSEFWRPLRQALCDWPQHVIDLDYFSFSRSNREAASLPAGPLVMVGHSFGYLHALTLDCPQTVAWVSINGFPCFGASPEFEKGMPIRILHRMQTRLETSPDKVINEFRHRCGAGPAVGDPNMAALRRDLLRMWQEDLRAVASERSEATLVLAGDADPIISPAMTLAAFIGAEIVWRHGAGHLLPQEDTAWCAAQLQAFLAQRFAGKTAPDGGSATSKMPACGELGETMTGQLPAEKRHVVSRFAAAAPTYEGQAIVQRTAAQRLAQRITQLDLPSRPRILEVGCGTGLFTRELSGHIGEAQWVITDIAAPMLNATRERVSLSGTSRFQIMDGEYPLQGGSDRDPRAERFDLICSNMAVQWFHDLNAGLGRLFDMLTSGGYLALTTLVAGTFAQWREAHTGLGLTSSALFFPAAHTLGIDLPVDCVIERRVEVEHVAQDCGTAMNFLRGLKAIGATAAGPGAGHLTVSQMRRVCRAFELTGAQASYQIAFCIWRKR